jgi:hypothetical protein
VAGDRIAVAWFREAGAVPRAALRAEGERLATILGRDLGLALSLA